VIITEHLASYVHPCRIAVRAAALRPEVLHDQLRHFLRRLSRRQVRSPVEDPQFAALHAVRDLGKQLRRSREVLGPRHSEYRNSDLVQPGPNIEVGQRFARPGVRLRIGGA
jgi:hypothetical protein